MTGVSEVTGIRRLVSVKMLSFANNRKTGKKNPKNKNSNWLKQLRELSAHVSNPSEGVESGTEWVESGTGDSSSSVSL